MTDYVQAREMWATLTAPDRTSLLASLEDADGQPVNGAGPELADHDWAGLPPQVHSAIIAGMIAEAGGQPADNDNADEE
jgi:hypothetical protein